MWVNLREGGEAYKGQKKPEAITLKGPREGVATGIWRELKLREKCCLARAVNLSRGTQPLPNCDFAEREREDERTR